MQPIENIRDEMNITSTTSRSEASRNKKAIGLVICLTCYRRFHSRSELKKHIKKLTHHKVDKEEIKGEYQTCKEELKLNDEITEHNLEMALLRLTLLDRL